jgi:hypothetical protein
MKNISFALALICALSVAAVSIAAADGAWPWSGNHGTDSVTLFLLGDVSIEQRADPVAALDHVRQTLQNADLVYGNLEGLLVKSEGPDKDIPDKSGWQHIGPEAVTALKAGNIAVVGVANNNRLRTREYREESGGSRRERHRSYWCRRQHCRGAQACHRGPKRRALRLSAIHGKVV